MSIVEFVLWFAVGFGLVSLGFYLGVTFNSRRYWDGFDRGYATAEADLNGLNGTVVRVEE
jgi:hypothetical protein